MIFSRAQISIFQPKTPPKFKKIFKNFQNVRPNLPKYDKKSSIKVEKTVLTVTATPYAAARLESGNHVDRLSLLHVREEILVRRCRSGRVFAEGLLRPSEEVGLAGKEGIESFIPEMNFGAHFRIFPEC